MTKTLILLVMWKALIGEAVGEGEIGMTAVAHVYNNRLKQDMRLGCVALKRKDLDAFVSRQPVYYHELAKKIVRKVFIEGARDITGGATHYENVKEYGKPYWADGMIETCKIGKHTFWKEKKR